MPATVQPATPKADPSGSPSPGASAPTTQPVLSVPDQPAKAPADVAETPEDVQGEVAQLIATMANISDPSHRTLGEVVASVNAVPRRETPLTEPWER